MPIKPENKALYPPNWDEISYDIRTNRAKNRCEVCDIHNYSVGYRDEDGIFIPASGNVLFDLAGEGLHYPSLEDLNYSEAIDIAEILNDNYDGTHYIVIVLTVAHLDHNPKNYDYSNLKAMCQKCHNNYDKEHRKQTRRKSKLKGQMALNFN